MDDPQAALLERLHAYLEGNLDLRSLYAWAAEQDAAPSVEAHPAWERLMDEVWRVLHAVYTEGLEEVEARERFIALVSGARTYTWQGAPPSSSNTAWPVRTVTISKRFTPQLGLMPLRSRRAKTSSPEPAPR